MSFKARYTTVDSLTALKKRKRNHVKTTPNSILFLAIWPFTLTHCTLAGGREGGRSPINCTTNHTEKYVSQRTKRKPRKGKRKRGK